MSLFENIRNIFDYKIREITKFSRKNFCEKNEEKLRRNYLENLYTFDVLEKYFSKKQGNLSILDIGCKNWFYAKGEHVFFKSFSADFVMDGVEIDSHRLYCNLYSRFETAKFYIRDLKNTNYIADDLLNLKKKYDYIIWFLPFVFKEPLVKWGLPLEFFIPEKLLLHAYNLLNDCGEMLIVNQGEKEAEEQKRLLGKLNIKYEEKGVVKSDFLEYKNNRYAFLVKK